MSGWLMLVCSGGVSLFGAVMMKSGRAFEEAVERVQNATEPLSAQELVNERDRVLLGDQGSGKAAREGQWEYRQVYGRVAQLEGEGTAQCGADSAVLCDNKTYSVVMDQMHECSDVLVHSRRDERRFVLETEQGTVIVDPSGCSLQTPVKTHYTHDYSTGPMPGAGVATTIGRAFSSEKEVGVLQTECGLPVGSTAFVVGGVRSAVDSKGEAVLSISACPNPRLPFVISDRPAVDLLKDMHDKALARQYLGLIVCVVGISVSLVEQLLPTRFRSYAVNPYQVREIVSDMVGFRVVEYVVSAPMNIIMNVKDALQVLRAAGKVQRFEVPAEVSEKGQAISFKFYYSKPTWTSSFAITTGLRVVGWIGVGIGALSVIDFFRTEVLNK